MKSIINVLATLACFALIGELVLARHSNSLEWQKYKRQHGKVYGTPEEDAQRFALFLAARDKVERHNANPSTSHKLGLNHLSDWTDAEFAKLRGHRRNATEHRRRVKAAKDDPFVQAILNDATPLPDEVDWRKVPNRVSPIKNQGQCGSCWAFASTGVLEGQQVNLNTSEIMIPLSEQDLIDCSAHNYGCGGGYVSEAFDDIAAMGGIESEHDYAYMEKGGKCKFNKEKVVMTVLGGLDLPNGEDVLKKFVARYGPVAIGIVGEDIQFYKSGIFNDLYCVGNDTDHAVLIVGYGTDPKEGDYWIVKNSWGADWGEHGYMRVKRGVGMCLIGTDASIAKV